MPTPPPTTCPNCSRTLDADTCCLPCAMQQALDDAAEAPELLQELEEGQALGFGRLADPLLPMAAGRFILLRRIASGGMGVVYEAEDTKLGRVVALKMMHAFRFASSEEQRRFDLEAKAAARLDHPHIVPVYEVGEIDGHAFLSMKYISGDTLAVRLRNGGLETRVAATLMALLAHAMQHAHDKGVLHRDLKPSNVLIDSQGHPWLIDFGMARLADAVTGLTMTGTQIGTPAYMAPEQAAGRTQEMGTAADIWALGAILYQMLTGELPYRGENHLAIMQAVINDPPPRFAPRTKEEKDLALLIDCCLQKDPVRRLGSAGLLAEELERWLAGEPILSRSPALAAKSVNWRAWSATLALGLAVALLVVLWAMWNDTPATSPAKIVMEAHIPPPDGLAAATFGRAIAIEGDTMLVGAPLQGSGAVHVYQRAGGRWMPQAVLTAPQAKPGDEFGRAVALHGGTIVIGAHLDDQSAPDSGAAYVFTRNGGEWTQEACLKAPSPHAKDGFGRALSIHGSTLVIGARLEDGEGMPDAGAAYVFTREGVSWTQQARLVSASPGALHLFGISVCVENDTILVGADGEDFLDVPRDYYRERQPNAGAAYVFTRSGVAWSLQSRLAPARGCGGCFGYSVALSGNTALIGAYRDNSSTSGINTTPDVAARESGGAFIFIREGGEWKQQAYLKPDNNAAGNRFGYAVALQGDMAVIGAYAQNSGATGGNGSAVIENQESGAAYAFQRVNSAWSQTACLKPGVSASVDHFGIATGIAGRTVVIGSSGNDHPPFGSGQVWTYRVK